jgi:hypothetical protein
MRVDEIFGGRLAAALEAFGPRGSVLHLSCGSGMWIRALLSLVLDIGDQRTAVI